jgi:cysteine desulfurase / selenocysteine lyase
MTTRTDGLVPTKIVGERGSNIEVPTAIDGATLDRITSGLMGSLSAANGFDPTMQASTAGVGLACPGVASSYAVPGTPPPRFADAPIAAPPVTDPSIAQRISDAVNSGVAAAVQTAISTATVSESRHVSVPDLEGLPENLANLDGSLPRLFDVAEVPAQQQPPNGNSSYYFLSPALAPQPANHQPESSRRIFDVNEIRRDFPILQERVHGKQLVWLDNAATTQKPNAVIRRLVDYYEHEYSNVHRGAHTLAARSTDAYESAREKLQRFLGAGSPSEIVFVRGTTEGVNLVAASFGRRYIGRGDEIVLSTLEHHSNIVPWQFLAEQVGAVIRVVPVTDRGEVLVGDFERTLSTRTRFVALTHVSNALGTILPVREMIHMAHRRGARVLIDGAQAVSHFPVNVQELDADFYVLSGHKLFGPSAIGVVYGKKSLLDEMPPWQGGGNMIQHVTFEKSTFADPPGRFEAGTAALAPAVGLGAAVDYLDRLGMENIARHERELLAYASEALARIPGVRLIGTAPEKAGVLSFVTDEIPAEEMGKILDQDGIAVRAGHHCAQPTMARYGLEATVRPSLALYNTHDEIDQLERAVRRALRK